MSMYRQMWLAIILSTLLALLGGLLASTLNARSYLSEQLSAKNTDNATALALVLSQKNANPVMMDLTVSALFDTGHYELIRVVDPHGITIVERAAPSGTGAVPDWFVKALPLSVAPGQAQISSGWNQLGTLTLISNSGFAYQALWKSVLQLMLALGLSGLLGGSLGTLVLRRLREPLERVINQASAISERRFVLIAVPDVPELRQLAMAMNSMVTRLKNMFTEEAQRLEVLRTTANYDPVTGLANRTFFLVQLLESLDSEDATDGTLLLVRVADFSGLNQRRGQPATNELLKAYAEVLRQYAVSGNGVAARISDTDFALLLSSQAKAQEAAKELLGLLLEAGTLLAGKDAAVCIGIGKVRRGQDIADLMAQATQALALAESHGVNAIQEIGSANAENLSREAGATAQLIQRALDQGHVRLASLPVLDMKGRLVHNECPLELMLGGADEWQAVSRFTQTSERFKLTPLLDLTAVRLGLEKLHSDPVLAGLAINLSAASLHEKSFQSRLLDLIRKNSALASRLWLEVPEAEAIKHILVFPEFVAQVRKTGVRVGLKQFGRHFSHSDMLHDLGLDFLKVDSSFIRGLQHNTDNQVFLKGLTSVAHKMGMEVFAEGVIDRAELATLEAAGFDGKAGPAVRQTD
jgi:EAL domain-containing protein (putative c-di-GMP-specific phosphodiesterase class I)/GGDEF domain-containing protein